MVGSVVPPHVPTRDYNPLITVDIGVTQRRDEGAYVFFFLGNVCF